MRIPRFYYPHPIASGEQITLDKIASRHLADVLRVKLGEKVIVFNSNSGDMLCEVHDIKKQAVTLTIVQSLPNQSESALAIHLLIALTRNDKMDLILQKAVELGVTAITPVITERSIDLKAERLDKKHAHWQGILIHAAQQSGRTHIPQLEQPLTFNDAIKKNDNPFKLILDPEGKTTLTTLQQQHPTLNAITLLIGSEGGFSDAEIKSATIAQFISVQCGPRILRMETAAIAITALVQLLWGDLK